jgi:lysophospholipase L1-like esterase
VGATTDSPETFRSYGTYSYLPGGAGGARITLTDSAGAIARNVAAVRFSVLQAGGISTVYREFDVFGAPSGSGRPPAFQRVSPDDSRIAYSDYARLVKLDASEARFDRPVAGGQGRLQNANPGARVRFRTDASMITASFTTGTLGITQGAGVILVDGVRAGTFDAGVSGSTLEVDVPVAGSGYRDVELLMPYSQDVRFNGLLVDGEADFQSPTTRPPIRYVAYGDSITEGFWSSDSYASYPSVVGQRNAWEVVNMGFGWRGMKDSGAGGIDGSVVGSLGADVISVMMGYNDASARLSASSYRQSMEAFVAKVREVDGTVPIYLVSPLFTSNAANQPRLLEYRDQIMSLVSGSPDRNLHWIDGLALGIDATNVAAYMSDGIHPNDAGFSLVGANLAARMSPSVSMERASLSLGGLSPHTELLAGGTAVQLQVVPEPAAIAMAAAAGSIMLVRRRRCRRASTIAASEAAAA